MRTKSTKLARVSDTITDLRSRRSLPGFVSVGGLTAADLTPEHWVAIGSFEEGAARIGQLFEFLSARVDEQVSGPAFEALRRVLVNLKASASCGGGVFVSVMDLLAGHWPGAESSHCDGCAAARDAEELAMAMAAAWRGHPDFDRAWDTEAMNHRLSAVVTA